MKIKFEEKQYENQMNMILACQEGIYKNKSLFSPGQVLEGQLGFDVAMHTCNKKFMRNFYRDWDYLFYEYINYWRHGMELKNLYEFHEVYEEIFNHMPNIKYNIFIQYKKPKFIKKSTAPEYWKWKTSYFRYKLTDHQQKILEELTHSIGNQALVIYASPAFVTQEEFWENVNNQTMIDNSNFCKVEELIGHHRYTYIKGGRYGIAFSEPEEVRTINIKEELAKLKNIQKEKSSNSEYINNLSNKLENIILESNNDFSKFYKMRIEKAKENELLKMDLKLYNSLTKINIFEEITGIQIFHGH